MRRDAHLVRYGGPPPPLRESERATTERGCGFYWEWAREKTKKQKLGSTSKDKTHNL